jgi:nitroreductase
MSKKADTDHPVHDLIAARWSPYGFSDRAVSDDDLRSLFEAARWAASSYNEQPWRFIVARREDTAHFDRLVACLVEGNQAWARLAPVLVLTAARLNFARNDKPNAAAVHDMGLAAGNLSTEATSRGLCVHQMIGIEPEKARELFSIPAGYRALTALAIGYAGQQPGLPEDIKARELGPRKRKPIHEFTFGADWGESASWAR